MNDNKEMEEFEEEVVELEHKKTRIEIEDEEMNEMTEEIKRIEEEEALEYKKIKKVYDKGESNVVGRIAWYLLSGRGGIEKDVEKAFVLLENKADLCDKGMGWWLLGLCYEFGLGTERDRFKTITCYRHANRSKSEIASFLRKKEFGSLTLSFDFNQFHCLTTLLPVVSWKKLEIHSDGALLPDNVFDIFKELNRNQTVTELDISGNEIEREGSKIISEFLKKNKVLKSLNLGNNMLGIEGIKTIAEGLKQNTTMKKLMIHDNRLKDEGARIISELLMKNSSLTELHIGENQISDNGMNQICEALKTNSTLKVLNAMMNYIGTSDKIIEMLKYNKTLKSLNLQINLLDGLNQVLIINAWKRRSSEIFI